MLRALSLGGLLVACGARTELGALERGDGAAPWDAAHDSAMDVAAADVGIDAPISPTCAAQSTTVLATWPMGGTEIAVDGAYVYFHGDTGLARVAKGGGPVEVLSTVKVIGPTVLRSNSLEWVQSDSVSSTIFTVPKTGGTPTTLLTESSPGFQVLTPASGDDVFLFNSQLPKPTLLEVTDTGTVTHSWACLLDAMDVETDDGIIYFAQEYGGVTAIDPIKGTYLFLGKGPGALTVPDNIRFDATTVYFMNYDYYTAGRWIMSAPKTGGTLSTLASHPDGSDWYPDMRINGSVYFTESQSGRVWRMNPDGSNQTVIATSQLKDGAVGLAVDDLCVYWRGGTHVYAAPR